ncbi:hypothetical protein [Enterococcus sp. LJL90]
MKFGLNRQLLMAKNLHFQCPFSYILLWPFTLNPNFREGRPKKFSKDQLELALELLKQHKTVSNKTGISVATLYREKAKRAQLEAELSSIKQKI